MAEFTAPAEASDACSPCWILRVGQNKKYITSGLAIINDQGSEYSNRAR